MANLTFIPNVTSSSAAATALLKLEDIPQEVRDNVEEVYTTLKSNPGRIRVEFGTLAELNEYVTFVKAYCDLRPDGPVYFRKSPTRKLPATTMDFRITDVKTEAEAVTEAIRENVEEVKTAAKSGK